MHHPPPHRVEQASSVSAASSTRPGLAVVVVLLVSFASGVVVRTVQAGLGQGLVTEHLVGYVSHGFVRRGLLGTIVGPFLDERADVVASMLLVGSCGVALLALLLRRLVRRLDDPGQRWTVAAVAGSVGVQLGWDLGRPDVLVLVVLVALWLVVDGRRSPVLATVLLVAGGLAHEMTLLWGTSLLVAAALGGRVDWRWLGVPMIGAGSVGLAVVMAGSYTGTPAAFIAAMPVIPPALPSEFVPRAAPWTSGPMAGVESVQAWARIVSVVDVAVLPAVLVTCFVLLRRALGPAVASTAVAPAVVLATVGIDHPRWAFLLAVTTVLHLALHRRLPSLGESEAWATAGVLMVLGAWGNLAVLPYWFHG